jgi:hypothetical protein
MLKVSLTVYPVRYQQRYIRPNLQKCNSYPVIPAMLGCMAAFTTGYSFDTIKIRTQTMEYPEKQANSIKLIENPYVGFKPALSLCTLCAFVYFFSFEVLSKTSLNISQVASISTALTLLLKVPSKVVIKSMKRYNINDVKHIIEKIYKNNGFRGFFRGFWLYIMSDLPENIIKYNLFEFFQQFKHLFDTSHIGFMVGIMTAVLIQPIDVLLNITMSNIENKPIQFKKINYYRGLILAIIANTIECAIFYKVMHSVSHILQMNLHNA